MKRGNCLKIRGKESSQFVMAKCRIKDQEVLLKGDGEPPQGLGTES